MALGTFADKQQITAFDRTGEVRNRYLMPAFPAPDIGEKQLFGMSGDDCPQLGRGVGKCRDGFDRHISTHRIQTDGSAYLKPDCHDIQQPCNFRVIRLTQ